MEAALIRQICLYFCNLHSHTIFSMWHHWRSAFLGLALLFLAHYSAQVAVTGLAVADFPNVAVFDSSVFLCYEALIAYGTARTLKTLQVVNAGLMELLYHGVSRRFLELLQRLSHLTQNRRWREREEKLPTKHLFNATTHWRRTLSITNYSGHKSLLLNNIYVEQPAFRPASE